MYLSFHHQVHLHRIRTDQITSDETVVQKDSSDEDTTPVQAPEEDEFDKLLQQQIEIARATPAPGSIKKTYFSERYAIIFFDHRLNLCQAFCKKVKLFSKYNNL